MYSGEMKFIRYFTTADQSACYYTFFTVRCEKSEILCWLVWAEHANCCHRIIEMMRTGFRKLYFFSYFLQRTSHDFENNRKMLPMETYQPLLCWKVSQPPRYAQKKVGPLLFLTLTACLARIRRAEEATTYRGREFKIRYFDLNERSYSINLQ